MKNEIYEYIRSRKGRKTVLNSKGERRRIGGTKVGVVLATVVTDKLDKPPRIVFGWSKANLKGGDQFDVTSGINIARTRALNGPPKDLQTPAEVEKIKSWFAARALTYFKGATL